MFEFHGWATIRCSADEAECQTIGRGPKFDAVKRVRSALNEAHDEFSAFDVRPAGNGLVVLSVHGLRNHRYEPVIDLFRRGATEQPDSYGLLYVYDDEDCGRGSDHTNEFRVWRMARGDLVEMADTLLSPYFPTVETVETFDDPA